MRNILFCLDLSTGKELWSTNQVAEIMGDQLYNTPCYASTPIVVGDEILLREMGSRGNKGPNKDIVFINKNTGKPNRKIEAGHVDYRAGYAPVAADNSFVVIPHGIQNIEDLPATAQAFNRILCNDPKGKRLWDFNIGPFFADPLLSDKVIYVGTKAGYLYALKADGNIPPASSNRILWQHKSEGAVNRKPAIHGDLLYFGSNDGMFNCVNAKTGQVQWQVQCAKEDRSFRLFSTPATDNKMVVVGSSAGYIYAFDRISGRKVAEVKVDDWVRSAPVISKGKVYAATMAGTLYCIGFDSKNPKAVFNKKLSEHPILADITLAGDKVLITDSDLHTYCLSTSGKLLWKASNIECFETKGMRIMTDQIAGGAYYQSKPTVVDGIVYFGTPARFLYAVNAINGDEIWKFEMGASISVSPVIDNGKVYAGQQGGEDEFYCLDAKTGNQVWSQSVGWVWGSCNVSDGMVFIPGIDGYVNALDAANGDIIWRYRLDKSVCSEPTVDSTQVFFGSWDHYLYAFDKKTGRINWKYQLSGGTDSGVAIYNKGKIFLPLGGNLFRCLDAKTGKLLWKYEEKGSVFNVTPAIYDDKVYVSCWHGLGLGGICVEAVVLCLDANTGKPIWTHIGGGLSGPVIGTQNRVYFPSIADPYLYCVDAQGNGDGTTNCLWKYKMGNKVEESTLALYGNLAYIMSSDGYVHAIK
jgi:outer membrane protein assembly factor BamB